MHKLHICTEVWQKQADVKIQKYGIKQELNKYKKIIIYNNFLDNLNNLSFFLIKGHMKLNKNKLLYFHFCCHVIAMF